MNDTPRGILKNAPAASESLYSAGAEEKRGITWDEENLSVAEAQRGQWTKRVTEPKTPYIHYNSEIDLVTGHSGSMIPIELSKAAFGANVKFEDSLSEEALDRPATQTLFHQPGDAKLSPSSSTSRPSPEGGHRRSSSKSSLNSQSSAKKSVRLSSAEDGDSVPPAKCEWDTSDEEMVDPPGSLAPEGHIHHPVHDADVNPDDLTPDERAHREAFAKKRQQHYNMRQAFVKKLGDEDSDN